MPAPEMPHAPSAGVAELLAAYWRGDGGLDFDTRERCRRLTDRLRLLSGPALDELRARPDLARVRDALAEAARSDPAAHGLVDALAPGAARASAGTGGAPPPQVHVTGRNAQSFVATGDVTVHGAIFAAPTPTPRREAPPPPQTSIPVLFLSADPSDAARLRLGAEAREVGLALSAAPLRDHFRLEQRTAVRPADLAAALLSVRPRYVHFSGHATKAGEICLEDELGEVRAVSAEALEALFQALGDEVECVVLNACYSHIQADAIGRHVPYVVGMSRGVRDDESIAFATGFYQAVAAGCDVPRAFKLGCAQMHLQGFPAHTTPVLKTRAETPPMPADPASG